MGTICVANGSYNGVERESLVDRLLNSDTVLSHDYHGVWIYGRLNVSHHDFCIAYNQSVGADNVIESNVAEFSGQLCNTMRYKVAVSPHGGFYVKAILLDGFIV